MVVRLKLAVVPMDAKGQTSFEYLLMVLFAVLLVIAATVIAMSLVSIAQVAQVKTIQYREGTVSSLLSSA